MGLKDLEAVILDCEQKYAQLDKPDIILRHSQFTDRLIERLKECKSYSEVTIEPRRIVLKSKVNTNLPSNALWRASIYCDLRLALEEYKVYLDKIKSSLKTQGLTSNILTDLPGPNYSLDTKRALRTEVASLFAGKAQEKRRFELFLTDKKSWIANGGKGRKLNRSDDWIDSAIIAAMGTKAADSATLCEAINAFTDPVIQKLFKNEFLMPKIKGGENVIFSGAPGTGKSYKINQICTEQNSIRTVFHSETQNSDFIGALRPMTINEGETQKIIYEYRPGPFTLALEKASKNKTDNVYLVIEEINRANAAAAFGEIFQLLDRDRTGKSEYEIDISDPDYLRYLKENTSLIQSNEKLYLPNNLSIYATMNNSDQGVFPMDTAFKRRWKFEYLPINFNTCAAGSFSLTIAKSQEKIIEVTWEYLAQKINETLSNNSIPEDRHFGPWFVQNHEIFDVATANKTLIGKVFSYLWEDVLRHQEKTIIFAPGIKTFSDLVSTFNAQKSVFCPGLESIIYQANEVDHESDMTAHTLSI